MILVQHLVAELISGWNLFGSQFFCTDSSLWRVTMVSVLEGAYAMCSVAFILGPCIDFKGLIFWFDYLYFGMVICF